MSSLFTNYFGVQNAKNFEQFVTTTYGNTYITIGKNLDWPNSDTPTAPTDTANTFYQYWNNVIALKKITAADMCLVVPRIDWVSESTYYAYTEDLETFKKTNSSQIEYDNEFYVRNTKDQVFKCLANNITSNTDTAISTIMPEITIGGQLPENAYIETADGYKWKYLYTIPPGLKQKFFTKEFMPITKEAIVTDTAVDGRLDVFKILDKGAGYNNNLSATSLPISSVFGDGTDAVVTLKVNSTGINGANVTDVNVYNAGSGYTSAQLEIYDPQKIPSTQDAVIVAVIGPPGGHGSDVARELGASNIMISVDITGDEDGAFPVGTSEVHGFRQIGMLMDPVDKLGIPVTNSLYRGTIKLSLAGSTAGEQAATFDHDELVCIREADGKYSFSGSVEHYDSTRNIAYITNVFGTPTILRNLQNQGSIVTKSSTILAIEEPVVKRYSGKLLYIENTSEITRALDRTVQFKFILRF